jgi:hypothetical protein
VYVMTNKCVHCSVHSFSIYFINFITYFLCSGEYVNSVLIAGLSLKLLISFSKKNINLLQHRDLDTS